MLTESSKGIVFNAPSDLMDEVSILACANFMDRTDYIIASCVKLVEFYETHGLVDKSTESSDESEPKPEDILALPAFLYSDESDEDDAYSLEAAEDDALPWGG